MTNRGEGGIGTLLSIVALVAIGAFMYWLYTETKQVEDSPPLLDAAGDEVILGPPDIANDPAAVVGRRAALDSVRVAAGLGQGVFSVELGDSLAYPVLMSPDAIQRLRMADVTSLYGGDFVYVEGQIYTLNDSIRNAWVEGGAVDRALAANLPTTPSFLLADSVVVH